MIKKYIILPKIYKPPVPDTGQWFVFFSIQDEYSGKLKRFRKSEGFSNCTTIEEKEAHAKKLKAKYTERLKNGWTPFADKGFIVDENKIKRSGGQVGRPAKKQIEIYIKIFLNDIKERRSPATLAKYKAELNIFHKWMQKKKLDHIDISYFTESMAAEFIDYLTCRGLTGKTKNQYLITLSYLWKEAAKNRRLLNNPWQEVKKFQEQTIPQRPLNQITIALIKKYLEKYDPQLWLAAQFMYYTLIRLNEIRFLQIKHLELWDGKINVVSTISKTNKSRIVDVNIAFADLLIEKYKMNKYPLDYYVFSINKEPGTKPVSKNYFWNHFNKARVALSLPRYFKFYGFKHTGAVVALKNGANIKEIQNQIGHSTVAMTDEYLKSMVGYESEFFKNKMPTI